MKIVGVGWCGRSIGFCRVRWKSEEMDVTVPAFFSSVPPGQVIFPCEQLTRSRAKINRRAICFPFPPMTRHHIQDNEWAWHEDRSRNLDIAPSQSSQRDGGRHAPWLWARDEHIPILSPTPKLRCWAARMDCEEESSTPQMRTRGNQGVFWPETARNSGRTPIADRAEDRSWKRQAMPLWVGSRPTTRSGQPSCGPILANALRPRRKPRSRAIRKWSSAVA